MPLPQPPQPPPTAITTIGDYPCPIHTLSLTLLSTISIATHNHHLPPSSPSPHQSTSPNIVSNLKMGAVSSNLGVKFCSDQ
ncbi:hypothetical protein Hanom_Chr11g00998741 [Helianthus anomalus]